MNSFGNIFRFTDFGESHGMAIGGVIDGCPSNIRIDFEEISRELDRRAGRIGPFSQYVSERAKEEQDEIEWLSGIQDGVTLGSPIAFVIKNKAQNGSDYMPYTDIYRPGHADYTYACKYGIRAKAGGGRASARESTARVVAGGIAKQILRAGGISIQSSLIQIGNAVDYDAMVATLQAVRQAGDSIGGIIHTSICGVPAGIGEPIFDKLSARLAYAMLSINACKGFSYGSGFSSVGMTGSQLNDSMPYSTNYAGGILGGISNGQEIYFDVVFKPTPSIPRPQKTIDEAGNARETIIKGRHDVCVAIRAVPIVEAMASLTLADECLQSDIFQKKVM